MLASTIILGDLSLPLLGWRALSVVLVGLGVSGMLMAVIGHLGRREGGDTAWSRLRFGGLMLAPIMLSRVAAASWLETPDEILVAAFSFLDLALLGQAIHAGLLVIDPRSHRIAVRSLVLLPAVAAVFLGLIGGEPEMPLMLRNAPAAVSFLLGPAVVACLAFRRLVTELLAERDVANERLALAEAESDVLRADLRTTETDRAQAQLRAEQAVEISRGTSRRARLLEQILANAVELHSYRSPSDLLAAAVQVAGRLFTFADVELFLWHSTRDEFVVRTHLADETAVPVGSDVPSVQRHDYDRMIHPRFRVSNSYFVPAASSDTPVDRSGDGRWPEGQHLLVPLTDPGGALHGFLRLGRPRNGQMPDLLHIRYLELLARQLAAVLESSDVRDRLAACRDELSVANDRLQGLGDLRSNFIANVSHELRTPLTSIIGYSEMLRDRGDAMTADVRQEFLSVIHEQGQKFREIIDDLLDLERMEDQSTRVERADCDIASLMRRLAEDWRQHAEQRGLSLEIDCPESRLVLEADPVLCQQLLEHLVDNAIKFTPPDGKVSVRVYPQGTAVRIEVQDTGIGIPEDKLHMVFEQFYQVDGSSTRQAGGQGVGLSICRDITSWHDGRIWAENMSEGGARLTVILPRRPHVVLPDPPATISPVFHDPRLSLQRLLHWVSENLGVREAVLLTVDPTRDHLSVLAAAGLPAGRMQDLKVGRGVGLAGRTWASGESHIEDPGPGDVLLAGGEPVLCVPLVDESEVVGVVTVRRRHDDRTFDDDDRLLLEAMAPRVVHLLRRYKAQDSSLRDFAAIQSTLRMTTRVGLLPHRDVAGVCHEICMASARRLGLAEAELRHLAFALRYYDVGLATVPPHVLHKTEALTDAERVQLERHVQASLVTLAPMQPAPKVREIILHHHENYDGSGYPEGLAGEAIPLGSRLVALTDSLRALLQRRPWRPAVPLADALAEIQAFAGTRYCPRLTAIFLQEAESRRGLIEDLRQHADDGEDLRRPASTHPVQLPRH